MTRYGWNWWNSLHKAGVSDYAIYSDEESLCPLRRAFTRANHGMAAPPDHPVMKSGGRIWSTSWRPIRHPPVLVDLKPVFICHEAPMKHIAIS